MYTISIPAKEPSINFLAAREQAVDKAEEVLSEPVIVAWKDDKTGRFGPEIPGGVGNRWHNYGENYGGKLELTVGNNYHFIFTDSAQLDKPDINLYSISKEKGGYFLCLNEACTDEDRKQFGVPYSRDRGNG
jgi:hypothetical protein